MAAFRKLNEQHGIILIGLVEFDVDEPVLHKLPEDDMQIKEGDYIIAIVNGVTAPILSQIFGVTEGTLYTTLSSGTKDSLGTAGTTG